MHRLQALRWFAEKVTYALHWLHDHLEDQCVKLQEQLPKASPFYIAAMVVALCFQNTFDNDYSWRRLVLRP